MIAGRDFDPRFGGDDSGAKSRPGVIMFSNVILNAAAVRKLGLGAPEKVVGKSLDDTEKESQVSA